MGEWTAYRGAAALIQISVIAGSVYGYVVASNKLITCFLAGAATFATGFGDVVAFVSFLGLSASRALTATNAIPLGIALFEYKRNGGFEHVAISVWTFAQHLVRGLN